MKYDVLVEEFGGDAQCSLISAKKGIGIDDLLEKILLQVLSLDIIMHIYISFLLVRLKL
jgi:translation initiation factor IF-2